MATISRRKLSEHAAERLASGDAVPAVMKELAAYLLETRRTGEAELIIRDIEAALLSRGTALVTTVSARELTGEAREAISSLVRSEYDGVTQVVLRAQIDPSVIGGVRLELPGQQLDATVRAKLEKLKV